MTAVWSKRGFCLWLAYTFFIFMILFSFKWEENFFKQLMVLCMTILISDTKPPTTAATVTHDT